MVEDFDALSFQSEEMLEFAPLHFGQKVPPEDLQEAFMGDFFLEEGKVVITDELDLLLRRVAGNRLQVHQLEFVFSDSVLGLGDKLALHEGRNQNQFVDF